LSFLSGGLGGFFLARLLVGILCGLGGGGILLLFGLGGGDGRGGVLRLLDFGIGSRLLAGFGIRRVFRFLCLGLGGGRCRRLLFGGFGFGGSFFCLWFFLQFGVGDSLFAGHCLGRVMVLLCLGLGGGRCFHLRFHRFGLGGGLYCGLLLL
jgi:hypothetical protein